MSTIYSNMILALSSFRHIGIIYVQDLLSEIIKTSGIIKVTVLVLVNYNYYEDSH